MGTLGTHNAALIWRVVKDSPTQMSEAEIREKTCLGVATVNRLVRTLATHGFMQRHEGTVSHFTALKTIDEVRRTFCPRTSEPPQPRRLAPSMPRVSSVWELGSVL